MNAPQGPFEPWFKEVRFTIHGVNGKVSTLTMDEKPSAKWKASSGTVVLGAIPWDRNAHKVHLAF
jgi:hypothetical protein